MITNEKILSNLTNLCNIYDIYLTKEKLKDIQKIKSNNFVINIDIENMKYKTPKYSIQKSITKSKSYSISLYAPLTIKYKSTKIYNYKKYTLLGEIPLITKKGSFIINGNSRVVIVNLTQVVRSSGIYFEENKKEESYTATIIPIRGSWLTIKIDERQEILILKKIDKVKKKIPIILMLQALGLTERKIFSSIKETKFMVNSSNKPNLKSTKYALKKLYKIILEKESTIMRFDNYNLGKIGRNKINKKIYKEKIWTNNQTLIPEDLLGTLNYLINLKHGLDFTKFYNLKNKRIRLIGEIMGNQIYSTINEIKKNILDKTKKIEEKIKKTKHEKIINKVKLEDFIKPFYITNSFKKFFNNNQLSQLMEETNPLTETTHKRKITSFGTGTTEKKNPNLEIREIHPSHYGRVCPIETAEGKNAGLIWSLAKEAKINNDGFIESPFYQNKFQFFKVLKGKIHTNKGIFFISSEQEKELILASADVKTKLNKINNKKISTRKDKEFQTNLSKQVKLINISPIQMISIGTSLIPFIEHNDANRALMGSNMQRQAVPLIKKEKAIVKTGIETRIAHDTEFSEIAIKSEYIKYSSLKKIISHNEIKNSNIHNRKNLNLSSYNKLKEINITNKKYNHYRKKIYWTQKNKISNQNIYLSQRPSIKGKNWVKKGQIIIENSGIHNGELALGKNLLVGYLTFEGYNFEDAIIISDRLVKEKILNSNHIKKYKTFLIKNEIGEEKITKKLQNLSKRDKYNLRKNGIVKNGTKVKGEDILVGKVKILKNETPTNRLLNILFKKEVTKNTSLRVPKGIKGTVINIKIVKTKTVSITLYIVEERTIEIGDKISGRHGNKGIISKILPIEDMPYLQDGTPLDIILNPLGIPSRMNIGQVFECLLGMAGKNLKENYKITPFDEMYQNQISKNIVFNKLNEAKIKTKKKWIFDLNSPGKTKIIDGKTGEVLKQPATIGYSYILKLMHLVKDKITARATGPYSLITQQPLKGKSRNGGQRFGEMEVWAIEGFGAAYNLQEIITIKSDDITGRYKTLNSIINGNLLSEPGTPESFKVLVLELKSLCLDINIYIKNKSKKLF
uniref:RNA polymerase subunit beta n=1 Tax=Flexiglena variabilis TaxID=2743688 RepID=UPI0023AA8CCF|nr:RNA polymerase subunit beta [Flexiglena variabilis]WCH63512.1 RNA polymerase subunit beta [Flexiglena variabilis]